MGCKGSSHVQNPNQQTEGHATTEAEKPQPQGPGAGETAAPVDVAPASEPASASTANNAEEDSNAASPASLHPPAHGASAPNVHEAHAQTPPANSNAETQLVEGGAKVDKQGRRLKQSQSVPPNFFQGACHNGFRVVPEVPAFSVSERNMASYSLPVEVLTFTPPDEVVVSHFANGDQERKIHCNIRLSPNELERMQAMRGEARAQGADFYPSVTAMATRFLSRARMDPKKAIKLMRETQEWRAGFFKDGPVQDSEVEEDMKYGIVYFSGRDCFLRPAIIIRPARIPNRWYQEKRIDKLIRILIFCMEYFLRYMVVPGRIENLNVIVDLYSLGIGQVPYQGLQEIYKVMSHHYIGRVYKFFVCNTSRLLSTMAGVVRGLLTDRQRQKLNILDDLTELHKDYALHQLETDLGGTRPKITKFFPFPMVPGPYDPGYKGEPDMTQVADVHDMLSHAGALGRLWDPKQSDENNSKLEYGPKAIDILKRCGASIPPELLMERETSVNCSRSLENFQYEGQDADEEALLVDQQGKLQGFSNSNVDTASIPYDTSDIVIENDMNLDEVVQHRPHEPHVESTQVCGSLFCCRL